jgi:hypothetical protein
MATRDELNSHAASRKRLAPRPKRYAVPPRIRKGLPGPESESLHSTRGLLWKKQGDRIPFRSRAPNKHALQLRRVHHYTSALLDFAMSFKRSRRVSTGWHSIRGLYQCLMDHVQPLASDSPSPRMKAWLSYLYVLSLLPPSPVSTSRLRSKCSLQEHDGPQHRKGEPQEVPNGHLHTALRSRLTRTSSEPANAPKWQHIRDFARGHPLLKCRPPATPPRP